jgi:hypothetical protein
MRKSLNLLDLDVMELVWKRYKTRLLRSVRDFGVNPKVGDLEATFRLKEKTCTSNLAGI